MPMCRENTPSTMPPPAPLEFGAIGDEVAALQAALLGLGYFGSGSLESCTEKGVFEDKTFASLAT